jgi:hypothetical protein
MARASFREQMLQAREHAIIAAVNRLLAQRGYDAMTVDAVAATTTSRSSSWCWRPASAVSRSGLQATALRLSRPPSEARWRSDVDQQQGLMPFGLALALVAA